MRNIFVVELNTFCPHNGDHVIYVRIEIVLGTRKPSFSGLLKKPYVKAIHPHSKRRLSKVWHDSQSAEVLLRGYELSFGFIESCRQRVKFDRDAASHSPYKFC